MTEKEKRRFIDYLRLESKLKTAQNCGSTVMLDGKYSNAEDTAAVCVFNDRGYYMEEITNEPWKEPKVISVRCCDE